MYVESTRRSHAGDGNIEQHKNRKDKKRHRRKDHGDDNQSEEDYEKRDRRRRSKRNDDDDDKRVDKKKSKHRSGSTHRRDDSRPKHKKEKRLRNPKVVTDASFRDKATSIDTTKLVSMGKIIHEVPMKLLDTDIDYFAYNSHLRIFLYRKYGIYFEDLFSDESHAAFEEFVTSYNNGNLELDYYSSSLPQEALDQCSRTKYNWKFRTNKLEEQSLEMVRAGVKKQTEWATTFAGQNTGVVIPNRRDVDGDNGEHPTLYKSATEIAAQRQSDKRHRERIVLANEEIHGIESKPDHSWERAREKKQQMSEKLHGAARDRDGDVGMELDDDAIYGAGGFDGGGRGRGHSRGGEISYEEAVANERQRRERREADKAARTSEVLAKETEKQKKMLEMLGLTGVEPGQKITIAPRDDSV
jgi:hypothetical protein